MARVTIQALKAFLSGPQPEEEPEPVVKIVLPPPPMYRDPQGGQWQPL